MISPESAGHTFVDEWLARAVLNAKALPEEIIRSHRQSGAEYFSDLIVAEGLLPPGRLEKLVFDAHGVAFRNPPPDAEPDRFAISLVPAEFCQRHQVVPWVLVKDELEVLMTNPTARDVVLYLQVLTGRRIKISWAMHKTVDHFIDRFYGEQEQAKELLLRIADEPPAAAAASPAGSLKPAEDPVIAIVNAIIANAVKLRASDIHLEQAPDSSPLHYRIDGVLKDVITIPKTLGGTAIVARFKAMAGMNAAERTKPQAGRGKLKVPGGEVLFRACTQPTPQGEEVFVRLLHPAQAELPLDKLGLRDPNLSRLEAVLRRSHGMVLVASPAGAGRTTTLYCILHKLRSGFKNLAAIEDPVEYALPGVNQVEVDPGAGVTFAGALRSVLRHDPDLIMVGDIRDRETAQVAFHAARAGRFVCGGVRANDSIAAISRLLNVGFERQEMAPVISAILAQRLVGRLCPDCAKDVPESRIKPLALSLMEQYGIPKRFKSGAGCPSCNYTGFRGRFAVTELLEFDHAAQDLLAQVLDCEQFREAALAQGWLLPLEADALRHVSDGDTSLEEVLPILEERLKPASGPAETDTPAAPAAGPAAKSLLLVDDDADICALLKGLLEDAGYAVRTAGDGKAALTAMAAAKPDLLITDMMMPGMSGQELILTVRKLMGILDLPIMVITAVEGPEQKALALQLGANDYINKPFSKATIISRINAIFQRLGPQAAAGEAEATPAAADSADAPRGPAGSRPAAGRAEKSGIELAIETDRKMDAWLAGGGRHLVEITAVNPANDKSMTLAHEDLCDLVRLLMEVEDALSGIKRKGFGLDDFLAFQEGGKLPLYRVQPATGDPLLLYSDAERREHLSRCAAEHLPAPDILELSEMARLESLAGRLKEMGLALKWFEADREARPKPLFHAKAWNGRGEGYSLRELLEAVREAVGSGLSA